MALFSVAQTGGKQYIVRPGDEIVVDKLEGNVGDTIEITSLASCTPEGKMTLGSPKLDKSISAKILESGKGTKIRIAKFKAKVRYRNVKGFRPMLTRLKIISV